MGVDKARLPWRGRPLAEHVAHILEQGGCERVFLVRRGIPDGLGWRREVVRESEDTPRHVLTGVATAARAAGGAVLVAACDLIDLDPPTISALIEAPGAVAWDGRPAAIAHIEEGELTSIEAAAARGDSLAAWAAERPRVDADGRLRNVNRWEDLGIAHPVEALVQRLELAGPAAERARAGERARLAARGCVLPP